MNKKTAKTNEATTREITPTSAVDESVEKAVTELVIAEINKILSEHGRTLQPILEGYPFMLKPGVRVVPVPKQVEEAHAEQKEASA